MKYSRLKKKIKNPYFLCWQWQSVSDVIEQIILVCTGILGSPSKHVCACLPPVRAE